MFIVLKHSIVIRFFRISLYVYRLLVAEYLQVWIKIFILFTKNISILWTCSCEIEINSVFTIFNLTDSNGIKIVSSVYIVSERLTLSYDLHTLNCQPLYFMIGCFIKYKI